MRVRRAGSNDTSRVPRNRPTNEAKGRRTRTQRRAGSRPPRPVIGTAGLLSPRSSTTRTSGEETSVSSSSLYAQNTSASPAGRAVV